MFSILWQLTITLVLIIVAVAVAGPARAADAEPNGDLLDGFISKLF